MVPSRGTENAKFRSVPPAPVRSIVAPRTVGPGAELPNPMKLGMPTNPSAIVVSETGIPDAYGMMAPLPANPVAPVAPVAPVIPAHEL